MPQDVYLYERLVIGFAGPAQRTAGPDNDRLSLLLSIKNPIGSPGSTRRPPNMEVWDADGRVYESSNDDWADPLLPDTEATRRVVFEVARDAEELELVLGPGEPDEVHAPIDEVTEGEGLA